jgi:hypothetical protein
MEMVSFAWAKPTIPECTIHLLQITGNVMLSSKLSIATNKDNALTSQGL